MTIGLPTASDLDVVLRVMLAGLLAGVIGWQRHLVGRPAGIRTHALVAMAAVCFAMAGLYGFGPTTSRDPARIAAQIVSGIGFIGAGTIFRSQNRVLGLTTAASLWFVAALGVLIAGGLIWPAIIVTGITFFLLAAVTSAIDRY